MASTMLTMTTFASITQVVALIEKVGGDLMVMRVANGMAYLRQSWWPAGVEMRLCVSQPHTRRAFSVFLEYENPADGTPYRTHQCDTAWKSRSERKFLSSMRSFLWEVVANNRPRALVTECTRQNEYKAIERTLMGTVKAYFGAKPGVPTMGTYVEPVVGAAAIESEPEPKLRNIEYARTRFTPSLGYMGYGPSRDVRATASITVEFPVEPADMGMALELYGDIRKLVTVAMDGPLGRFARAGKARNW